MTDVTQTLDTLLRSRYQGASNITGIRFQLLYSVLHAFELYADQVVHAIAARSGLAAADLPAFLRRVSFEHMSEDALLERLRIAVIRSFDLTAGNELLYLSHLVDCAIGWAANRAVLQKRHLE